MTYALMERSEVASQATGKVVGIWNAGVPAEQRTVTLANGRSLVGEYLYVVHGSESTLYGVLMGHGAHPTDPDGDNGWHAYGWLSVDIGDNGPANVYAYPLSEVAEWPRTLSSFLAGSTRTTTGDTSGETAEQAYARGMRDAQARFDAWKEQANQTAIEYAENNELCGEFERCMEAIGMRGRETDYSVTVTVTVPIVARNYDAAYDQVYNIVHGYNGDARDLVNNANNVDISVD